ncbi:MAG: class F sortase [bacterium]|nr:class F sortase [bacterium]
MPKAIILISLVVLVLIILAGIYVFYGQQSILPDNENEVTNNEEIDTGSGLPKRLTIPSISVDAPVINVGLTAQGAVEAPKTPHEVAWYQLGPRPGEKGSSVITGHFGPWQTGASSVFDNLNKLKTGDKIYVKDDKGNELNFEVTGSRIYQPHEAPTEVFNKTDGTYLNLITCNGEWLKNQDTYNQRLVVFTKLVE